MPLNLLLVVAAIGGAGLWYITRAGWQRVTADITTLVRYEDEHATAGNDSLVLNVQDTGNRDWLDVRRAELERALAAPLPLPLLSAAGEAPVVERVEALDAHFVTAEVRRQFHTPAGDTVSFVLPQIYRRDGPADWKRTAPPGGFWGPWEDWRSPFLHVRHSGRDAAFVDAVAPQLEFWVQQACDLWSSRCSGALPARLYLSGYVGSLDYDPLANTQVRVEFGDGEGALPPDYFLSIPSPQLAGMPGEPEAQTYLAEYLAVRLIAYLAARSAPDQGEADRLAAYAIKVLDLGRADPGIAARAPLTEPVQIKVRDESSGDAQVVTIDQSGSPPITLTWVAYTVEPGDSLLAIANRFNVTVEAIVQWNAIPNPDLIIAGTTLQIPVVSDVVGSLTRTLRVLPVASATPEP
jgi:LysM repeat protein